jgi:hypothetical protein
MIFAGRLISLLYISRLAKIHAKNSVFSKLMPDKVGAKT